MKIILRYVKQYKWFIFLTIFIKMLATFAELFIPYVLEYMLDTVAPTKDMGRVALCTGAMLILTAMILVFNITANKMAVLTSRRTSVKIRKDLFQKSLELSGRKFDEFGLPSIASRMTSDSYNIQDFIRAFQTMGIRGPLMLIGGIVVSLMMDRGLGLILCVITPISLGITIFLSFKGIPLYDNVQRSVDEITLVMRENITGIRVIKALSKEKHEIGRFKDSNDRMIKRDRKASTIMAMPGPVMTLFLNIGLILVVIIGANRVNAGITEPGVILAFLTYFNMILMGSMGLGRILLQMSKANASSSRIEAIIDQEKDLTTIDEADAAHTEKQGYIVFDNVSFSYLEGSKENHEDFAGEKRKKSLENINFTLNKGESLGIIGPTGCGKTTIINLLMRFYDPGTGGVFIDGRDVRTYDLAELRKKFGVAFQNDMIFADTIAENIKFGRDIDDDQMKFAAASACADEFIEEYDDSYQHMASSHGANFSGGQRQRILLSRALAGSCDILILDDSSSALDYKTDSSLRHSIKDNYDCTTIIVAQRISSILSSTKIIVMDAGEIIGIGTHEELMESCQEYKDIYNIQMGGEA